MNDTPTPRTDAAPDGPVRRLAQLLQAPDWTPNFREGIDALTALLGSADGLAQSQARESWLRSQIQEALRLPCECMLKDPVPVTACSCRVLADALAANPPPVVPIAIAEQLAEALNKLKPYAYCACPEDSDGVVRYHSNCARKAMPIITTALAAFEPYKMKP